MNADQLNARFLGSQVYRFVLLLNRFDSPLPIPKIFLIHNVANL